MKLSLARKGSRAQSQHAPAKSKIKDGDAPKHASESGKEAERTIIQSHASRHAKNLDYGTLLKVISVGAGEAYKNCNREKPPNKVVIIGDRTCDDHKAKEDTEFACLNFWPGIICLHKQ
jgi:hypothetical protein